MLCFECHNHEGKKYENVMINGEFKKEAYLCLRCSFNFCRCELCRNCFKVNELYISCYNLLICKECSSKLSVCKICNKFITDNFKTDYENVCFNCFKHPIFQYSYKPEPVFHLDENDTDNIFMGVELEVGGCDKIENVNNFCRSYFDDISDKLLYFKSDCSIPAYGVEIVSHPCSLKFHENKLGWNKIMKDLSLYKINSRRGCGMHVHVNKDILTEKDNRNIDLFFYNNFEFMRNFTGRNPNYYCYRANKHNDGWGKSMNRYQMINFMGKNTIEFRIFSSTFCYNTFIERLQLVHSLINFIKTISVWENNKTVAEYASYIFNNKDKYNLLYKKAKARKIF